MTDNNHPITPPPELVHQWAEAAKGYYIPGSVIKYIATQAARWGADQELEACCQHLRDHQWGFVGRSDGTKVHTAVDLQLARRPKPPSLKELALSELSSLEDMGTCNADTIRRALEALPND